MVVGGGGGGGSDVEAAVGVGADAAGGGVERVALRKSRSDNMVGLGGIDEKQQWRRGGRTHFLVTEEAVNRR